MTDTPGTPDHDLLRRFLAGEAQACRAVEAMARTIVSFRPYGIPRDEHDDVVQQSLAMVWRACSASGFELRTGLKPLVRKVVMARCIDALRRRRPTTEVAEELEDAGLEPAARAVADDEWARVQDALGGLGAACQEIVRLHFFEELSYAEIAARLNRAEATLRVRMFHCMKELRARLGEAPRIGSRGPGAGTPAR
jgi:RNA polymerase sigma-70 factor (ECF subfamily)